MLYGASKPCYWPLDCYLPLLQVADPEDACQPFTYTDTEQTWVALISRSQQLHPTNCTFDVKVCLQQWYNLQRYQHRHCENAL